MRYFDSGVLKFSRSSDETVDQDVAASSNSNEIGLFCNLCIQVLDKKMFESLYLSAVLGN